MDGYRAALEHAGIPADPALVRTGDFHFESALAAATDMLDLADPPTAIFAGNDIEAMGVYEAARRHGLRIPDDLSVVGFDDLPMSAWVSPPLTTRGPAAGSDGGAGHPDGAAAATDGPSNRVELATSLVIRSSTAAPRHDQPDSSPIGRSK